MEQVLEHLTFKIDDTIDHSFINPVVTFKTSLEVIQRVMNVPMCALKSLLRSNGYNDSDDETSLCIDEERLDMFSEAYARKMKSYFTRSLQNIASLPRKERSDFDRFVELFKKQGVSGPKKWDADIDVDRLKKAFVERVKEEAFSSKKAFVTRSVDLSERVCCIKGNTKTEEKHIDVSEVVRNLLPKKVDLDLFKEGILERRLEEEQEVLGNIVNSEYYIAKHIEDKPVWCGFDLIKRFISTARYYIYSTGDDEESHSADFKFMGDGIFLTNSTGLRLCS